MAKIQFENPESVKKALTWKKPFLKTHDIIVEDNDREVEKPLHV
jgi:hypothetical protein